ncbi:hypothetical protein D3C84_865530 [compost metagenome]
MVRSKITPETRTKANQMRTEGRTYAEIALALSDDGITLNWCKKNLNSVAVYDTHYFLIEELTPLALRPDRLDELHGEICALYPNASSWHVRDAILSMVTGSHPAGPIVQGRQMSDAVSKMEERVPQRSQAESPAQEVDHEYDSLCM